ncbi:MAG TPA: hypothetical protein VF744_02985 [Beijerinckiaceae bacterium]|jgi:hypothetical protein
MTDHARDDEGEVFLLRIEFMDTNPAKIKTPFKQLELERRFLPYLGQVALLWGEFESYFDQFLETL